MQPQEIRYYGQREEKVHIVRVDDRTFQIIAANMQIAIQIARSLKKPVLFQPQKPMET